MLILDLLGELFGGWDFTFGLGWGDDGDIHMMDGGDPWPPPPKP